MFTCNKNVPVAVSACKIFQVLTVTGDFLPKNLQVLTVTGDFFQKKNYRC